MKIAFLQADPRPEKYLGQDHAGDADRWSGR